MDESDSDASPDDYGDTTNDDIPYPLEGKYKNAADKDYVLGLTEVEREQVLAEREEEAATKRRELQLKSLLDAKEREAEKSKKRKAAADVDDDRRPSRAKTAHNKALDAYKLTREQAKEGGRRRTQIGRNSGRSRSQSLASSRDASGSPDVEYATANSQPKDSDLPIELFDIERIRVGRSRLAQICFFPGFEQTVIGCFVRVCIGQDPQSRRNMYRMTTVKSVVTGAPYLVDATPVVQPFYTDQYVKLAHGKAEKSWSFMHCSDSSFVEEEFNRWKYITREEEVTQTTKPEAARILDGLHAILNHHLTSEEINAKIAKRDKFKHLFATAAAAAPKRTQSDDVAEKLRLRNEKTRKQNAEDVRKALMGHKAKRAALVKAKARHERAAAEAAAIGTISSSLAVPKSDFDALFSEGSDVSRAASPAVQNMVTTTPQTGTGTNTPQKKVGRFSKITMDDDIISGMDLAIDIEI
jgi:RNA polymerase-associated protein RTF1